MTDTLSQRAMDEKKLRNRKQNPYHILSIIKKSNSARNIALLRMRNGKLGTPVKQRSDIDFIRARSDMEHTILRKGFPAGAFVGPFGRDHAIVVFTSFAEQMLPEARSPE